MRVTMMNRRLAAPMVDAQAMHKQVLVLQMIGVAFFAITIPLTAALADRVGRWPILIASSVAADATATSWTGSPGDAAARTVAVFAGTAGSVARDMDLTETAVREWVKQAERDEGKRAVTSALQLPTGIVKRCGVLSHC